MKVLVLRLSSFGDIIQCMSVLNPLRTSHKSIEIDWVARSEFCSIIGLSGKVDKIWSYNRNSGLRGLFELAKQLKMANYTHVYDAHSTIRSRILSFLIAPPLMSKIVFVRRSKERLKRLMLFSFNKNFFPKPFLGMASYLSPIDSWIDNSYEKLVQEWDFKKIILPNNLPEDFIALAPSAAWSMKTWPIAHWKKLISLLPNKKFVVIGGPDDSFCQQFSDEFPGNTINMAGKLSLDESCYLVSKSSLLISADTGLIHVADILGRAGISLLGPTAFGRCTGNHIHNLEVELSCRPCTKDGRGTCSDKVYQKCMIDITPEVVCKKLKEILVGDSV